MSCSNSVLILKMPKYRLLVIYEIATHSPHLQQYKTTHFEIPTPPPEVRGRRSEGFGRGQRLLGSTTSCSACRLVRVPPVQVVDDDELQHGGIDEEHAHTVPQVHGSQVGNDG